MAIRAAHDDDAPKEQHAINVTPLIDAMLALIVFMVAAPSPADCAGEPVQVMAPIDVLLRRGRQRR